MKRFQFSILRKKNKKNVRMIERTILVSLSSINTADKKISKENGVVSSKMRKCSKGRHYTI